MHGNDFQAARPVVQSLERVLTVDEVDHRLNCLQVWERRVERILWANDEKEKEITRDLQLHHAAGVLKMCANISNVGQLEEYKSLLTDFESDDYGKTKKDDVTGVKTKYRAFYQASKCGAQALRHYVEFELAKQKGDMLTIWVALIMENMQALQQAVPHGGIVNINNCVTYLLERANAQDMQNRRREQV